MIFKGSKKWSYGFCFFKTIGILRPYVITTRILQYDFLPCSWWNLYPRKRIRLSQTETCRKVQLLSPRYQPELPVLSGSLSCNQIKILQVPQSYLQGSYAGIWGQIIHKSMPTSLNIALLQLFHCQSFKIMISCVNNKMITNAFSINLK